MTVQFSGLLFDIKWQFNSQVYFFYREPSPFGGRSFSTTTTDRYSEHCLTLCYLSWSKKFEIGWASELVSNCALVSVLHCTSVSVSIRVSVCLSVCLFASPFSAVTSTCKNPFTLNQGGGRKRKRSKSNRKRSKGKSKKMFLSVDVDGS